MRVLSNVFAVKIFALLLMVSGCTLIFNPVLAASVSLPGHAPLKISPLKIPTNSSANLGGTDQLGVVPKLDNMGTKVNLPDLKKYDYKSWPALRARGVSNSSSKTMSANYSGGAYAPLVPYRLLDTRITNNELGPNGSLNLTVINVDSVPSNATAVAINVTVTNGTAASYLSIYPADGTRPVVSNLNWVTGETVPNLAIIPVGENGQITFYNHSGDVNVIADLEGYFVPETTNSVTGSYVPLSPVRIVDTRPNSGFTDAGDTLSAKSTLNVIVNGLGGIPTSGDAAILANVTVTDTTANGYLTLFPQGTSQPLASNLNWGAGETVANRVIIPVGSNGGISLYNSNGDTNVVIDVNGYFNDGTLNVSNESLFTPMAPVRILDTRQTGETLAAGASLTQQLRGVDGISSSASAAVTNVTVTNTTAASYLTVYPSGNPPIVSDINWSAGQTVPNLTVATLSSAGGVNVYNDNGVTDVLIDAFGYFVPIGGSPLSINTTQLPNGTSGMPYSTTLSASGGTSPYAWSISSGSLPAGLSLSSNGTISGTTNTSGDYSFGVQVTDSSAPTPQTASTQLSISISASSSASLTITTSTLPNASVNTSYSATLSASGGATPYFWTLTSGSLPPGLSLSSAGVISGTPSGSGDYTFGVQVTDSSTPTPQTASTQLSIAVSQSSTNNVVQAQSTNWSGYAATSGPYTAAQGTFNVPVINSSSSNTDTAEWVGIDGFNDSSLIQAGIDEPYTASSNTYTIYAWWEILPAPETPISMSVSPGDSITITLDQISGSNWGIKIVDNTNGQSFTIDQTYSAPLSSAEWIVEAPTNGSTGTIETLGGYSPNVTFTNLGTAGSTSTLYDISMVQNGQQVSTPSTINSTGFSVAYGSTAPPPP